ncbi:MAG: AAA family ATPase [Candidatus Onthovivens sp.]|nr:AAA family ATPase [Candidatus Onthovivens sp.]
MDKKQIVLDAFKDYEFFEGSHTYYLNGKKVGISTTGLIHQYSQEFDKWTMSANVASKRGVSQLDVLEEWRIENLHSTIKGSMIHEFAQSLWEGKDYIFKYEYIPKEINLRRLQEELLVMSGQAINFYKDYKDLYDLIGCEIYLGVPDFDECGATDMLLKNKFTDELLVIDFKSNKKIDYESFGHKKMKVPLQKYEDCNYIHYSLQLNAYAYKIEYMTGIKVKDKLLIYFDCNKDNYEVIEPLEMRKEVIEIYENRRVKNMNSVPVLLIGKSGSGKSASMRNFKKDEIAIVNVLGKPLPFKNDLNAPKCDNYATILAAIEKTDKKTIVIDDANYLITNEFMTKSGIKGFDKYNELANNFWNLIQGIKNVKGGKTVYLIMHEDTDDDGNVKPKTIGKLLDDKVNIQGMFTVCIRSMFENGNYIFRLKNNGQDCVKTPIGMFEEEEMENDLKKLDEVVREYYDLDKQESEENK